MSQRSVVYFLKLNKINGWTPIGYKSMDEIVAAGYHNEDGSAHWQFAPNSLQDGAHFYCNASNAESASLKFEFIEIQDRLISIRRTQQSSDYGFISTAEYEQVNKAFGERKKGDELGSIKAPFAAVKVSANVDTRQRFTCWALAKNIQVQRAVNVGFYDMGFT